MDFSILFASDADITRVLASAFACNTTFFSSVLMGCLTHDISGGLEVNFPLKLPWRIFFLTVLVNWRSDTIRVSHRVDRRVRFQCDAFTGHYDLPSSTLGKEK